MGVRFEAALPLQTSIERFLRYRRPLIILFHGLLVWAAYLLAFMLRFDFRLSDAEWALFWKSVPIVLATRIGVFAWFRLYEGMWRYASVNDLVQIVQATTASSVLFTALTLVLLEPAFPRSIFLLDWLLCVALVAGVRLSVRVLRERARSGDARGTRAVIVGAGEAGEQLLRATQSGGLRYHVVGLVDDDPRKQRNRIRGVKVLGVIDNLPQLCASLGIEEILLATPSAGNEERRRIMERCRESNVPVKSVPSLEQLLTERAGVTQLQDVRAEDLLRRERASVSSDRVRSEISGKRILITGAGGSIGSELCRHLAVFEPELLLLLDRAESSLYLASVELARRFPQLATKTIIGDILDERKMRTLFESHAPDIVYHAAAYKHVPLMEEHPLDAIRNNIFGVETVARLAIDAGVEKFVFISTDKAVAPVSVMGRTKRVAESLLSTLRGGPTTFVSVRFGNVLGSDGSVLPLFRWQISEGGPVTVTDAEATRYFMLISEAAQLVLEAGAIGQSDETFTLNMGEPVRVIDLAENLIRLSGLRPGQDIAVETVGLRSGERLREELVRETEIFLDSENEQIWVTRNPSFDPVSFRQDLEILRLLVDEADEKGTLHQLQLMATRY